jgi:hypothetical protein
MTLRLSGALIPLFALIMTNGCAGPQKAADTQLIKGTVGKQYSDLMSRSGLKVRVDYGSMLASETLADGSTFYLHVQEYESASSSTMGIWGEAEYSYRLFGFKVKDDLVQDWAYGLFTPKEKASVLFGFKYGYDHPAMLERIKKDYANLIKTSSEESIAIWKK